MYININFSVNTEDVWLAKDNLPVRKKERTQRRGNAVRKNREEAVIQATSNIYVLNSVSYIFTTASEVDLSFLIVVLASFFLHFWSSLSSSNSTFKRGRRIR